MDRISTPIGDHAEPVEPTPLAVAQVEQTCLLDVSQKILHLQTIEDRIAVGITVLKQPVRPPGIGYVKLRCLRQNTVEISGGVECAPRWVGQRTHDLASFATKLNGHRHHHSLTASPPSSPPRPA